MDKKVKNKLDNDADDDNEIMLKTDLMKGTDFTETTIEISANNVLDEMSVFSIFKNLLTIGVAFMLLFSAFNSFTFLQSSLNKEDGLGTSGLSSLYASMVLTNLFITPLTLARFSEKWIIVGSMSTYIVYVITGFYPAWSTVIPGSLIIGFGWYLLFSLYVIPIFIVIKSKFE
jgi:hypothetical protein